MTSGEKGQPAAARYHPEFMVRALRSSFEHYASDPAAHNTVPGEFGDDR